MISSARQGCTKSVAYGFARPSWSLALHAESSAQALLRAKARLPARPYSRQAQSRARFSAAAAAVQLEHAEEEEVPDRRWDQAAPVDTTPAHPTIDADSIALPRAARSQIPSEMPLVKFRRLITNDPLSSLLTLPYLPPDQLWSIALFEFDVLISSLKHALTATPPQATADLDEIHTALVQLRGVISDHPQAEASRQTPLGKRFRRFIQICLLLGDRDLVRSVWMETLDEVARKGMQDGRSGDKVPSGDRMVQILAEDLREWRMILWMFSPSLFPDSSLTPMVLERYLQAHLATGRPEAILSLFHKHAELGLRPTPDSYNHLLQAMLALGNMEAARAAAIQGREEGGLTKITQQLAILRGHRALGAGIDLEEKVLRDLRKLEMEPTVEILNALIRLRVVDGDLAGAERLLGILGLDKAGSAQREAPSADSVFLALKVAVRSGDLPRARGIWSRLCETPGVISDSHLSQLIYALDHGEGYDLVRSLLDPNHPITPNVSIPRTCKPGIRTLNALLSRVPQRDPDLKVVNRTLCLLPRFGCKPDDHTIKLLLELLSKTGTPPEELAALLRSFLLNFPELHPTISQVNTILSTSLQKAWFRRTRPASEQATSTPSAGLTSIDPLRRALTPILADLRKRGAPSDSTSLAIRLRYDALTHASAGGMPTATAVWDNIIERGYRPNKRHILALISGYADSGAMVEAESVLRLAKEVDVDPTDGMWMALLSGWSRQGNHPKAYSVYRMVDWKEGGADIIAMAAMVQAYYRAAAFDKAAEMVRKVLLPRYGDQLDQQALLVAAHALRSNNEVAAALDLVAKYRDNKAVMSAEVRKVIRQLRNWLGKQSAELGGKQGKSVVKAVAERERKLEICDWILEGTGRSYEGGQAGVRRRLIKSVTGLTGKGVKS